MVLDKFKSIVSYTKDDALAFLIDTGMTNDEHKTRIGAKQRRANIYLSYEVMIALIWLKKRC